MYLPLDQQHRDKKWLHGALFALIGALVVLALGAATAFAEGGEESEGGPLPTDPVVVPEVETPVTPPVSVPESNPAPSASAPPSKASEPAPSSSGSGSTRTPTTRSGGSSGGSKPAPTTVNHNSVRGPASSGSGSSGAGSTGGSGSSGSSPQSVEPGAASPAAGTAPASAPTRNLQNVANDLAARAGQAPAKSKKARQDAVARLGKALGTALLGKAAAVSHPKQDQGPVWVPLPGKSKLPYMLVILAVLGLTALVVWTQFRGPRESRRWKARVDHRAGSASGFTLAPGNYPSPDARPRPLRAAAGDPNPAGPKRDAPRRGTPRRAPRRKAA
jgi:hypothetical protein